MKISDLLAMCLKNLLRRKFLTSLTIIGVVIGTTAIVMMISLVIGMSNQMEEQLKMWGDLTMIEVWGGGGDSGEVKLNDEAIATMQAIPGVDVATPFMRLQLNSELVINGGKGYRYVWNYPELYGIYPEAMEKMGYRIAEGRPLPEGRFKRLQAVFGGSAAYNFEDSRKSFDNMRSDWPDENGVIQDPFFDPFKTDFKLTLKPSDTEDTTIRKLEYEFEVVGKLEGERNKYETVYGVFMPLKDLQKLQEDYNKENKIKTPKGQKNLYSEAKIKAVDMSAVPEVEKAVQDMGFGTWSMENQRQEMQKRMLTMQIILGGIGGITLFVSAISITNTMIMSVYERTREIGVMKVLGCVVGNIRAIFLIEAGFIGFFGGVFGIGFSYLLSFLLNTLRGRLSGGGMGMMGMGMGMGMMDGGEGMVSSIPPWLVLLGLSFATGIGIVAGFYPANRAVKISALEAIKQE